MTLQPTLNNRGVVCIQGEDRHTFLQTLITNDIYLLKNTPAIYTAMLNHQGKYLFDFFIIEPQDESIDKLFLDVEKSRIPLLLKYFTLYKLRSKITMTDVSNDYAVAVFLDTNDRDHAVDSEITIGRSFLYKDPRIPTMGWRFLIHTQDHDLIQDCMTSAAYRLHRLHQGIAEGSEELIPEKSIILEYGFNQLGAISWNKGCYLGQELMARTKHRGMLHKRLFIIEGNTDLPPKDTLILLHEQKIGTIRQQEGPYGIALLRCAEEENLEDLQCRIDCSTYPVTVKAPRWWPQGLN